MTAPPSWFCRWAKLLLGSSPWVLDIGSQPVKTSVLPCCKPLLPSLWQSDSKWSSPKGPPGYFSGVRPELELPKNNPQFWRTSILGSFPPGKTVESGELASLGEGWCSQHAVAPLTLRMQSLLVSVMQEGHASVSPLHSRIFLVVSCPWIVVSCFSPVGEQNQGQVYRCLGDSTPAFWIASWLANNHSVYKRIWFNRSNASQLSLTITFLPKVQGKEVTFSWKIWNLYMAYTSQISGASCWERALNCNCQPSVWSLLLVHKQNNDWFWLFTY